MAEKRKLDNWIEAYREFTAGTESPAVFHLWVALSTISSAAQRKISLDMGYFDVHSNMYIILTSPPGRSRKSTALRIGKSMLRGLKDYGQEINFSTQASSAAALIKQLSSISNKEHQSLTAFSSELGSLLGTKNPEITDFLTDIYDCDPDWDKQTISRDLEKIQFPWLNLVAATTPQWLGDNLSKTAVEGGFVARSVFVYEDTRLLVAWPELTKAQIDLKKLLIHDLAVISMNKGRMKITPEAKEFYKQWYEDPKRLGQNEDSRVASFFEREHIHVLKVAMALSLAAKDKLELQTEEIRAAIDLVNMIKPGLHKAFSAVGRNIHSTVIEQLRMKILEKGRIPYKKLLAVFINDVASREDFDKLLASLVDMGDIKWDGKNLCDPRLPDSDPLELAKEA